MIGLPSLNQLDRASPVRIWLATAPTDMRCGFDRLAELARTVTGQDPCGGAGHLFLFRSKRGDRLKALYWDKDGYALWYKRLEEGTFRLPEAAGGTAEVSAAELALILEGIDVAGLTRRKRYARP
jgi:transposase